MSVGLPTASDHQATTDSHPVPSLLKRSASPSFDCVDDNRKRMKQDKDDYNCSDPFQTPVGIDGEVKFADVLADDFQCGCCSELVYKPVLVIPCQHFFCGRSVTPPLVCVSFKRLTTPISISCCMLWIRVSTIFSHRCCKMMPCVAPSSGQSE
jgi:hypothetical protein